MADQPPRNRRKNDWRISAALTMSIITVLLVVVVVTPLSIVVLRNTSRTETNGKRIDRNERRDTLSSREALTRQCLRSDYTRAELHVAYTGTGDVPRSKLNAARHQEPLLVAILEAAPDQRKKSLRRVQRLNPIVLCTPNLNGGAARTLTPKQQAAFVKKYKALKLDPLPTIKPTR